MFRFLLIASVAIACVAAYSNVNDVHAQITKLSSDIQEDGHYGWELQTTNGIAAQESGLGGHQATGGYSYYSPEGELVQISYLADENGFQPQGSHIPTPPPIPAAILKSLEYIRTHPQYVEPQQQHQVYRQPVVQTYRKPAVQSYHAPQYNAFQSHKKY